MELEAQLIAQEHRPIHFIRNFLNRSDWPSNDPRRKAAIHAVFWGIFFSPNTLVAGGGLIAIATLVVLVWQGRTLSQQTLAVQEQVTLQIDQDRRARRIQMLDMLWTLHHENKTIPANGPASRTEAALEFLRLERPVTAADDQPNLANALLSDCKLIRANLTNVLFAFADLRRARLDLADLNHSNFYKADLADAWLTEADLRSAVLIESNLSDARLRKANLSGAYLSDALFCGADLSEASLRGAILKGADFNGAKLKNADLTGADFEGAKLSGADLTGARGLPAGVARALDVPHAPPALAQPEAN